jgi:hypothetical protein
MIGTPYKWGGVDSKQGLDCSAFVSQVWGLDRQTTDTLQNVSAPVAKDQLRPGDALNLPTWKDPRGYGHVRMFDGWVNPEKTRMRVYESSSATNGVVHREIDYDPSYQPMRLTKNPEQADLVASDLAVQTEAAGHTQPSRPPGPTDGEAKNLSIIGQIAIEAGLGLEGAKVAKAIAGTEGGLSGRIGDEGKAHGWFQMHEQGELANYARDNGLSIQQARAVVAAHPEHAAAWALVGYLGKAIKDGQAKGLTGADLATYAQTYGQRSKTPEKAGEMYRAWFSDTAPVSQSTATTSARQLTDDDRDGINQEVVRQTKAALGVDPEDEKEAGKIDAMTEMVKGLPSPIWKKKAPKSTLQTGFAYAPYAFDPTAGLYDVSSARSRGTEYTPLLG